MWIVLLDHSASMAEPFAPDSARSPSGSRGTGGRGGRPWRFVNPVTRRRDGGRRKLDVAVESVSNVLGSLPPLTRTVLVGFTDSTDVGYEGRAGDRGGFERTLRTVAPTGGTDVAAALGRARLHVARLHVAGLAEEPSSPRLLLVTDDLADPGELLQAAYDCAHARIAVDIVLIDPSDRARDLAATMAEVTGGRAAAVSDEAALGRAVRAASRRVRWRGESEPRDAPAAGGPGEPGGHGEPGGQDGGSGWSGPGRPRRVDVSFPVFSLVPELSGGNVERIQESLRTIVPFLEELTGLRYYPPATYVTDDTTVTGLRHACEPDARRLADEQSPDVGPGVLDTEDEELTERARGLLLTFYEHVLDVGPDTDLDHVRREALGGFVRNARRHLAGRSTGLGDGAEIPGHPPPPEIWRQRCADDFPNFAGLYCELVTRYVDRHIRARSRNHIDPVVRARLVTELGPRVTALLERSVGGVVVDPPVDHDYRKRLVEALAELRAAVSRREPVVSEFLRSGAPMFGVFRHSGGAGRFGRSGMLVPPGAPAVLLGAGAFTKVAASLRGDGVADESTWDRAASFCELTLLHEHAHAAVAVGLDEQGTRAAAAGTAAWTAASRLNEALAAWTQRHFYRHDPQMSHECTQYIRSGSPSSWPYRGADALEELFRSEGVAAVRRFVRLLRDAPEAAQREFDLLTVG